MRQGNQSFNALVESVPALRNYHRGMMDRLVDVTAEAIVTNLGCAPDDLIGHELFGHDAMLPTLALIGRGVTPTRGFRPRLAHTIPDVASGIRYSPRYVHGCAV